ncbi:hypothetical protein E2C01_031574 [Portunus trituberculatus]|uniref:Uncharacterized protein n=1 Tax=Portunus trituberculatus TaxID=210409 RepID=A0A5B7EYX8_PORTR|nr:hypothetical protein [Portunus trituberculatus]
MTPLKMTCYSCLSQYLPTTHRLPRGSSALLCAAQHAMERSLVWDFFFEIVSALSPTDAPLWVSKPPTRINVTEGSDLLVKAAATANPGPISAALLPVHQSLTKLAMFGVFRRWYHVLPSLVLSIVFSSLVLGSVCSRISHPWLARFLKYLMKQDKFFLHNLQGHYSVSIEVGIPQTKIQIEDPEGNVRTCYSYVRVLLVNWHQHEAGKQ